MEFLPVLLISGHFFYRPLSPLWQPGAPSLSLFDGGFVSVASCSLSLFSALTSRSQSPFDLESDGP